MIIASLLALAGADAAALTPTGKWTVDYLTDKCEASRPFGNDPASASLIFQPFASIGATGMRMIVVAPNNEGDGNLVGKATIILQPSGATRTLNYTSWVSQPNGPRNYQMFVDAEVLAQIGPSTGLAMETGKESVALVTGKLQLALDAAVKCNLHLLRSWGVDPAAKAMPIGNPGEWFTDDDYPAAALRRHVQGHVKIALTIDSEGQVKGCRVVITSGDPDLDQGTCDVARTHAHYVPKSGGDRFDLLAVHWAFPS